MINDIVKKIFPKGHFHWQNLNEKPGDELGLPIHGRCWLYFDDQWGNNLHFSWNLWSDFCHVQVTVREHEDDIMFSFAIPPVSLWLGLSNRRLNKFLNKHIKGYDGRQTGIRVFDWSVWWDVWSNTMSWSNKTPKWRDGSFNIPDFFLGKWKYSEKELESREVEIPMPEKTYNGTVKMQMATWKRPRWFAKKIMRAHIDMKDPIPIPGKGSASYNCGDDATHSLTCPARNIPEAVGKLVGSTLETRMKRSNIWKWEK
jgi:hypothetical protein